MPTTDGMTLSPGNAFSNRPVQMRLPSLNFLYRLDCEMAKENHAVGAPFAARNMRLIMPIVGGTVEGPRISGTIQEMSGADWGTIVEGTEFMRLDARYTLRTDDEHYIYVRSKGIFKPRAGETLTDDHSSINQDQVEWFTRLQFEAGAGPYNWMNGVFAIGVLSMFDRRILIDAYQVTNFPDEFPEDTISKP